MSLEVAVRAYIRRHGVMGTLARLEDYAALETLTAQAAGNQRDAEFWAAVRGELIRAEGNLRVLMNGEAR